MPKLRYKGKLKIEIPYLKSKGGTSIRLPLFNYNTMLPLPDEQQIIDVSEDEASDLIRSWGSLFEIIN